MARISTNTHDFLYLLRILKMHYPSTTTDALEGPEHGLYQPAGAIALQDLTRTLLHHQDLRHPAFSHSHPINWHSVDHALLAQVALRMAKGEDAGQAHKGSKSQAQPREHEGAAREEPSTMAVQVPLQNGHQGRNVTEWKGGHLGSDDHKVARTRHAVPALY